MPVLELVSLRQAANRYEEMRSQTEQGLIWPGRIIELYSFYPLYYVG